MNGIINPMVFYWVDLFRNLKGIGFFCVGVSFMALVIIGIHCDNGWTFDWKTFKKPATICGIVIIISLMLSTFIPSESTMYKMLIAKYSTPNNIERVVDYIDESVEKILEVKDE